jgi:hypothetical protein
MTKFIFFAIFLGALAGCDFDRIDEDRRCDTGLSPSDLLPEETDQDTVSNEGSSKDTVTEKESSSSAQGTDTDYSCFNAVCKTDADCTCTPRVMCPQAGPDFIKHHCMIIDCDPNDPATCPEDTPCINVTAVSQGLIEWTCFEF